jgi:hypothetical protein
MAMHNWLLPPLLSRNIDKASHNLHKRLSQHPGADATYSLAPTNLAIICTKS